MPHFIVQVSHCEQHSPIRFKFLEWLTVPTSVGAPDAGCMKEWSLRDVSFPVNSSAVVGVAQ